MRNETHIYTIKEINKYIRMRMDVDPVLSDVWLRGEVSNFTHHSSGHMYFTLKDKESRIKCVMFASHNARLKFMPREGSKVLARGTISVFERDGAYQFYANDMQPDGLGSLYLAYEQLKAQLEEEGLFAQSRKRSLPLFPRQIGVVTSPTGAAVRDIITTLQRRYPIANIVIAPVQVQGQLAAPSIVKAIQMLNREGNCDVLIVGRGGGSLEELWAFNEESVAREIAASAIPVISAVGHETDFTIADFVADIRAATPTAAAELAVPHLQEVKARLTRNKEKLSYALNKQVSDLSQRLRRAQQSSTFVQPKRFFLQQAERVDYLQTGLQVNLRKRIDKNQIKISQLESKLARLHPENGILLMKKNVHVASTQLEQVMKRLLDDKKLNVISSMKQLDALSPLKVMARGYSLAYSENQQLIKNSAQVHVGDRIHVKLSDATLNCVVEKIKEDS